MSLVVVVVVIQDVEIKKIMRWRKVDSTMKPYDCNGDMKRGEGNQGAHCGTLKRSA